MTLFTNIYEGNHSEGVIIPGAHIIDVFGQEYLYVETFSVEGDIKSIVYNFDEKRYEIKTREWLHNTYTVL